MTSAAHKSVKVFCSYSHKDEIYLDELKISLTGLRRQGLIEEWYDREIVPGQEWEKAIDKNLKTSEIILLLVTPAFMSSDYVYEKEMNRALDRHERGEARVIPIIIRPADWEWAFGDLQALPKDAKPISTWLNQDEAWLDVVRGIRRAVKALLIERQEQAAKEEYRKAVVEAWTDRKPSERAERLSTLANELGLGADTAADIERETLGDTKEAILECQERAAREAERRNRLDELYVQARRFHRDQDWQAIVDVFNQIHELDPEYHDPEGLLISARETLAARETIITASNADQIQVLHCIGENELFGEFSLGNGEEHTDQVSSVAFSPDGRLLASGSHDNTMRLWRVEDAAFLRTLEKDTSGVTSVAFSPGGRLLASGSHDKTVRLWRVEDGALLRTLEGHTDWVDSVAFAPDGRLLASADGGVSAGVYNLAVRLWQVKDGALLRMLEGHRRPVISVAFSPDGRLLASGARMPDSWKVIPGPDGYYDHRVLAMWLWRVEDGELLRALKGHHTDSVNSVTFSPDGRLLASGSDDHTVQLWGIA